MNSLLIRLLIVFVPFAALSRSTAWAQDHAEIDSLLYLVETARDDSTRVKLLIDISREYAQADIHNALQVGEKALRKEPAFTH